MKPRAALPSTAFTLPAKYYTDRGLHERELELFFRRMWVCVGRFSELPDRGSFIMRHVAGDSIFIVRTSAAGEPDSVKAVHNLCRHRGPQLCRDERGRFQG
jgi:phenylpropionate dioxygenase-like ring-hydroxylating dioxygenase large terminal subunit